MSLQRNAKRPGVVAALGVPILLWFWPLEISPLARHALAIAYGYFDARDMLRVGFLLTIVESLVLLYVVPFYWPAIGLRLR